MEWNEDYGFDDPYDGMFEWDVFPFDPEIDDEEYEEAA